MSDNRRVYRRIKQGLLQLYPKQLTGNQARHLNTLTGMMTGIVQSKRCHFELMAAKAPDESQVASRVKRFSRYTQNETIDRETYFMPFIEELVAGLARQGTLVVEIPRIEDVIVRTPQQFAKQDIQAHICHEVLTIDPTQQQVTVRDLETGRLLTDSWDQLILTTGGAAVKPPLPSLDLPGIFTLRQVEEAMAVRHWIEQERPVRAVIVGGGYIGLEMVEALAAHHLPVTLVERLPQVMPNMDAEMSRHILDELTRQGVDVHLEHTVEAFGGNGRVKEVAAGGRSFPADMVIFSVGARSNNFLAKQAGLILGPTGAVAVNERQQTSVPNIWAAGDVAEARHLVTGKPAYVPLGTTANKQGRVAGTNAAGGEATFQGIVGTAVVKVFDLQAARTGLSETEARAEGFEVDTALVTSASRAHYMPEHPPLHVKLVFERSSQRLLGAQMVGQEGVAKRIDVIAAALQAGRTTYDWADLDLSYAPPFAPVWDPILVAANVANH